MRSLWPARRAKQRERREYKKSVYNRPGLIVHALILRPPLPGLTVYACVHDLARMYVCIKVLDRWAMLSPAGRKLLQRSLPVLSKFLPQLRSQNKKRWQKCSGLSVRSLLQASCPSPVPAMPQKSKARGWGALDLVVARSKWLGGYLITKAFPGFSLGFWNRIYTMYMISYVFQIQFQFVKMVLLLIFLSQKSWLLLTDLKTNLLIPTGQLVGQSV